MSKSYLHRDRVAGWMQFKYNDIDIKPGIYLKYNNEIILSNYFTYNLNKEDVSFLLKEQACGWGCILYKKD